MCHEKTDNEILKEENEKKEILFRVKNGKIFCTKCKGENIKDITGMTIGDPLKNNHTTVILKQCKDCNHTLTVRIENKDKKRSVYIVEHKKKYDD